VVGASRGCGGAQLCPRPPSTGSQAWQPVGGIRPHGGIHPARTRTGTRRERERLCGHATRRPRRFRVRAGTCFIARPMSFPSGRMCACRQPHRGQSGTGVAGPCDQTTFLTILARPPKRSPPQNPGRCSRWFEGQFVDQTTGLNLLCTSRTSTVPGSRSGCILPSPFSWAFRPSGVARSPLWVTSWPWSHRSHHHRLA